MKASRTPLIVYAVVLAVLGAPAAHAQTRDEEEHACRGDAIRLCIVDVPDKARITECMKAHYEQLSPACKALFHKPSHPDSPRSQRAD
ncbi:MAG TPA: hypothetical protein VL689_15950 [Paraburkholderia sp.]|jgi:hypothetical protein|nr:hypothetical protein [Paraburkholderia sp.]